MRFKRRKRSEGAGWMLAAGVVLSGAAAAYAVSRLLKAGPVVRRRDMRALEKRVLQALLNDSVAQTEGIDIAAVGVGVLELTGVVDSETVARHVVNVVNGVAGVHAVLNRLQIRSAEANLQRNRSKAEREPTRWYGGSVGMGRRRQSADTDPGQRDDHAAMLERSLQPNRDDTLTDVEEAEANGTRIGVSHAGPFRTNVAPHSPNAATDAPGAPPAIAPHEMAQRE